MSRRISNAKPQPQSVRRRSLYRAIALTCCASAILGCETDDDPVFVSVPVPLSSVSEPAGLNVSSLATAPGGMGMATPVSLGLFGTVVADATERLVNRVTLTNFVSSIDSSGNRLVDQSGNPILSLDFLAAPFAGPLGQDNGIYWTGTSGPLSVGGNQLVLETEYDGGEQRFFRALGGVTIGNSWMKESALHYDASGNLLSLDQIKPALLEIDRATGVKMELVDFSLLTTLLGASVENPTDFVVDGADLYLLDNGSSPGIYMLTDFRGAQSLDAISCTPPGLDFVDPVDFAVNPAATGPQPKFFVLDRASNQIVTVAADNTCSVLTPNQVTAASANVLVDPPLLDIPIDIAYYPGSGPGTDSLFVSGEWLSFDVLADASGNPVDASGNAFDASGNPIVPVVSVLPLDRELYGIDLTSLTQSTVSFRLDPALDTSGNDLFPALSVPDEIALRGDELFVFDNILLGSGLLSIDLTSDTGAAFEYIARPVSGGVALRSETTTVAQLFGGIDNNPDDQIPFTDAASLAIYEDRLTVLSPVLGAYIDVDISPPPMTCVEVPVDPDEGVLQCDYSATRILVPGGATITCTNSETNPCSGDIDGVDNFPAVSGFIQTSRSAPPGNTRLQQIQSSFQSAVPVSPFSFITFNRALGVPVQDFLSVEAQGTTGSESLNELLVESGRALALQSPALNDNGDIGSEFLVVDGDRLLSFFNTGSTVPLAVSLVSDSGSPQPFVDPFAAFIHQPVLPSADASGNPVQDASGNTIIDASEPTFYHLIDKNNANALTRVVLAPSNDAAPEMRGDRSTQSFTGADSCDFDDVVASRFLSSSNVFFGVFDFNGDLVIDESENEGAFSSYTHYSSLYLVNGVGELIEADLISGECVKRSGMSTGVAGFSGNIVALDATSEEVVDRDGSGNAISILSRSLSFMALDQDTNNLYELSCVQQLGAMPSFTCNPIVTHTMTLNEPRLGTALTVDWVNRDARVFDDRSDSVLRVDIEARDSEGAPVDPQGLSPGSGQTVIETRTLPLNCDPLNDEPGCRNL